jgi:hypothetical protein
MIETTVGKVDSMTAIDAVFGFGERALMVAMKEMAAEAYKQAHDAGENDRLATLGKLVDWAHKAICDLDSIE